MFQKFSLVSILQNAQMYCRDRVLNTVLPLLFLICFSYQIKPWDGKSVKHLAPRYVLFEMILNLFTEPNPIDATVHSTLHHECMSIL